MEKYEEVLHNLEFARELHKTLDGLTQSVRVIGDGTVTAPDTGLSQNTYAVMAHQAHSRARQMSFG